jgi:hypothetical protein
LTEKIYEFWKEESSISMVGNYSVGISSQRRSTKGEKDFHCPPLKLCRQYRVCGKEAVFDFEWS